MKYLKAVGSAALALVLVAAAFVAGLFDRGVDAILKDFSKLDAKLNRAVDRLRAQADASLKRSDELARKLRSETSMRVALYDQQDRALRVRERLSNLVK